MGSTRSLLVLTLTLAVGYCLKAPTTCPTMTSDYSTLIFSQTNRTGNIVRFCQSEALKIRREHFWCRGYIGENGTVVDGTAAEPFPESEDEFWTVFLQFPALSFMDVARKQELFDVIGRLATDGGCSGVDFADFCVANVETYRVSEYRESVLVTIYNLGVTGSAFDNCFNSAVGSGNTLVVRFRSKRALRLTLNVSLADMYDMNIGPASSIGDENRDPTLRPIILGNWPRNLTLDQALDRIDDDDFATNPDPINYGLEAGDIVFAFFGSVLLVVLGFLVVLGYFIHPVFLS